VTLGSMSAWKVRTRLGLTIGLTSRDKGWTPASIDRQIDSMAGRFERVIVSPSRVGDTGGRRRHRRRRI